MSTKEALTEARAVIPRSCLRGSYAWESKLNTYLSVSSTNRVHTRTMNRSMAISSSLLPNVLSEQPQFLLVLQGSSSDVQNRVSLASWRVVVLVSVRWFVLLEGL
jgi:hypothetical protein